MSRDPAKRSGAVVARPRWKTAGILLAIVIVCGSGFWLGRMWDDVNNRTFASLSDWSRALQDGKEITYSWVYRASNGDEEVRGRMIEKSTGRTRMIEGREFREIGFRFEEIPLPSGSYYVRAGDDVVEMSQISPGSTEPVMVSPILELPIEVGRSWPYAGKSHAEVRRISDYRDESGRVWKDAVLVAVFVDAQPMGEIWLHSDVGVLGLRMFLDKLGYHERQLISVK